MRSLFLMVLVMVHSLSAGGVDGLNSDASLNRPVISKAYFEGDFDLVVNALEAFRKMNPNPSREDRIYVYKYLSVIYAAQPETRAKAESFMYQLLKIMPSIELMDLYISDNIEAIFNTVRMRFEHQQKISPDTGQASRTVAQSEESRRSSIAPLETEKPKPARPGDQAAKRGSTWIWWSVGAVGVAAAVVGYVYLNQPFQAEVAAPRDSLVLE
ncbi:MAG: hypothetical protein ABIW76_16805 [Fibrobacteria bacterium]